MRDRLAAPSPASYEAGEPQEYHVRRLFTVLLLASAVPAVAQGTAEPLPSDTVDFAADSMSYDDKAEIVTATGNVLIVRGEYRLRASEVAAEAAAAGKVAAAAPTVAEAAEPAPAAAEATPGTPGDA